MCTVWAPLKADVSDKQCSLIYENRRISDGTDRNQSVHTCTQSEYNESCITVRTGMNINFLIITFFSSHFRPRRGKKNNQKQQAIYTEQLIYCNFSIEKS